MRWISWTYTGLCSTKKTTSTLAGRECAAFGIGNAEGTDGLADCGGGVCFGKSE